jgi:hypothetical protein
MFLFLFFLFLHISTIFSSIEIIKVRENVNVTITCHFNRIKSKIMMTDFFENNFSSENIILWYKDDTQVIGVNSISNNPRKYFLNQLNIYTYQLTIINVQLESSGLYRCQNFTAKEENHFQLHVIGMKKIFFSSLTIISLFFSSSTISSSSYSINRITCY